MDVFVTETSDQLQILIYTKATDKNIILHFNSAHLKHLLTSLQISQFCGVIRLCTDEVEKYKQLVVMYRKFVQRRYPAYVRDMALQRVVEKSNGQSPSKKETIDHFLYRSRVHGLI